MDCHGQSTQPISSVQQHAEVFSGSSLKYLFALQPLYKWRCEREKKITIAVWAKWNILYPCLCFCLHKILWKYLWGTIKYKWETHNKLQRAFHFFPSPEISHSPLPFSYPFRFYLHLCLQHSLLPSPGKTWLGKLCPRCGGHAARLGPVRWLYWKHSKQIPEWTALCLHCGIWTCTLLLFSH